MSSGAGSGDGDGQRQSGSEPLVRGVVVAHGTMAQGLADAVRRISGFDRDALRPVSNEGCSPESLYALLSEAAGEGPAIIFTDLQSGSCAISARITCRNPNRAVVSGVNLPMLLDFVFNRNLPLDELVSRVVDKGRESVQNLPRPVKHVDPPLPR